MRILFAALDAPFPASSGRRIRNLALLRAFSDEGHQVTMVCFDEPIGSNVDLSELQAVCTRIDTIPLPDRSSDHSSVIWQRVRALTSALPYGAWRLRSSRYQERLLDYLAKESFDVLICDDIYVAANIPVSVSVPIVINKHGIGTVVLERFLPNERNPFKKAYGQLELAKTRRWEASICDRSALIMACSDQDRAEIARLSPKATTTVVPNVIDVREYDPSPSVTNHTVVFVAYMGWYPNQDAVEFFVTSVLPPLRKLVPDIKFVAAGRNPPDDFRCRLSRVPGVEFTGAVPDIRPIIAEASVCVVPLRIGTGTRLKILEGAALEKPIVSTRIGAEGLDFIDRKEIVLADDPQEFAREVADLLISPARARAMGLAARKRVEQQYSMPALRESLRNAVAEIRKMAGR